MSSNCLACTDPINACPVCPSGQSCVQTGRSCSACPKRICQDTGSSGSTKGGGGGGTSTAATAGGAVGGVVGVALVLAALYFFWWRPRGLAASRKRYSKHLVNRQSKVADSKRKSQLSPGGTTDAVAKRSSVHLHMDAAGGEGAVNRRNTSPGAAREGGALTPGRTSEDDNPFGDQNRSSIGDFDDTNSIHTSEFSFRSSHTNVIPIAYIPPHSSSMSIADGQRGAFGESPSERDSGALPPRSQALRASIPTSMASRDSLALAGAEIIELNPLPPVLTPDTPAVPHGTLANGAPIRPPRSPGLDLKLPNTPKVSSPLAGSPVSPTRPNSGGVFPPLPPSSGSPGSSPNLSFLSTSPGANGRGMSVLGDPRSRSAQSHLSTITTRSATSTMSYILDPPQIITPVSAQGVRRVELQKGQAGLVKIGAAAGAGAGAGQGNAASTSPTSPAESVNPFDDSNRASVRHSRLDSQETVQGAGAGLDAPSRPRSSVTDTSRWTTSSLVPDEGSVQFLQGQTVTFTNPNSAVGGCGRRVDGRTAHRERELGQFGPAGQRDRSHRQRKRHVDAAWLGPCAFRRWARRRKRARRRPAPCPLPPLRRPAPDLFQAAASLCERRRTRARPERRHLRPQRLRVGPVADPVPAGLPERVRRRWLYRRWRRRRRGRRAQRARQPSERERTARVDDDGAGERDG
ncbi:hypothetical protein DMC30DRAFT_4596 [Rhodotorula diobovata]|uniref:Membrane anchor Opy2 N-terminal domain-containing protein n=1 Tax=Rhodotorula diobovata TaxID=5288 RepID=A0A5C5G6N5_9BASI|nr:hypothetical protein DMC30DRAFT_4596 [Rhodotorula diobovata]